MAVCIYVWRIGAQIIHLVLNDTPNIQGHGSYIFWGPVIIMA